MQENNPEYCMVHHLEVDLSLNKPEESPYGNVS
jgi:hypothetical protein